MHIVIHFTVSHTQCSTIVCAAYIFVYTCDASDMIRYGCMICENTIVGHTRARWCKVAIDWHTRPSVTRCDIPHIESTHRTKCWQTRYRICSICECVCVRPSGHKLLPSKAKTHGCNNYWTICVIHSVKWLESQGHTFQAYVPRIHFRSRNSDAEWLYDHGAFILAVKCWQHSFTE